MRRRSRDSAKASRRAAAALLAGIVLLAGCGTVRMEPPEPDPRTARMCRALVAQLPDSLSDQERVAVQPESDLVAAWGSPAIALRCGVERPAGLRPESHLTVVNDIAWLAEPEDAPVLYTSVGRAAYVELTIPAAHMPPALTLVTISELIQAEIPALPAGEL